MVRPARARTVRVGNREIVAHGLEPSFWRDLSHQAMLASWPRFIAGTFAVFMAFNLVFAIAYYLAEIAGQRAVANVATGSFIDYLYFSMETLATVGYGDMHPVTHYGHIIASIEMFSGIFCVAVITGLNFARFSRPRARVVFANNPVVTVFNGKPTLMMRIANERHNTISNAAVKLWLVRNEVSAEGARLRRFHNLALERSENPLFTLSWTVIHPIDDKSPLAGQGPNDLKESDAALVVVVNGLDETSAQTLHARHSYTHDQIRFGHRYVDILRRTDDGRPVLDYHRFHDTEAIEKSTG